MQEILAGKPGTKVNMELIRLGEAVQASFVLAPFTPPTPAIEQVEGVAKLRIATFDGQTAEQVKKALQAAGEQTRRGLLIDLRGVSSGDPEAAYATAKLFTTGDLGALKKRSEEVQTFDSAGPAVWQGRLVVLVDRGTLGASEILATVLRQKAKAELVGERTFGYAGRQGMASLSTGGRLLFTEAFYTGPDKKPIREALKPDLLVDERVRTYLEKDVPMSELILKRGVQRLLGTDQEAEQKAA
jgi:carboxyl-terminal processing protease